MKPIEVTLSDEQQAMARQISTDLAIAIKRRLNGPQTASRLTKIARAVSEMAPGLASQLSPNVDGEFLQHIVELGAERILVETAEPVAAPTLN